MLPAEQCIDRLSRLLAVLGMVLLSACATTAGQVSIPAAISQPPAGNLQLAEAMRKPDRHLGTKVRWGGNVISVRKGPQGSTEIEILQRQLNARGRPQDHGPSDGRFLIRAAASVDSALYRQGSRVTVAGVIKGTERRQVGKTTKDLVLVEVSDFIQWTEERLAYPYYDDPYYGYPYYGYPYYGPYYHWPYYYPGFHLGFGYSN